MALKDTKEGDRLRNKICKLLGYADDLVMSDISLQKLIEDLEDLDNAVSAANMNISEDKSNMLTIGGEPASKTQINGKELEQVQQFQYLRSVVDSTATDNKAIENRIRMGNNTFGGKYGSLRSQTRPS